MSLGVSTETRRSKALSSFRAGGFEEDRDPGGGGDLDRGENGGVGDLELEENELGRGDAFTGRRDVDGREARVRSRGNGDAVLAAVIDDDESHAGRGAVVAFHEADVDPVPHESGQRLAAEGTFPTRATRAHAPPPGRRDGLIGALASRGGMERPADDRFPGTRDARHMDDHIGVRAADDDDARLPGEHTPILFSRLGK